MSSAAVRCCPPYGRRLLSVLALLLGLFAMHGLASAHADLAPMASHGSLAPVSPEGLMQAATDHVPAPPGMGLLCLAVLTAGGLGLLGLLRVSRGTPAPRPPDRAAVQRQAIPVPRPPPDLFRLCVSRT